MAHEPDTIVLIHGLWMTPRSWEHWEQRYESRGYTVLAPAWPGMLSLSSRPPKLTVSPGATRVASPSARGLAAAPGTRSRARSNQSSRQIVWPTVVTVISAAILIGAEVFGAAFAGGWALAILLGLDDSGAHILQAGGDCGLTETIVSPGNPCAVAP